MPGHAELHALSCFSFRRAASRPGELIERAAELGYRAIAITDECSMVGIVRAFESARECGIRLIVGSEFRTACGLHLVLLAPDQAAYGRLCRLITRARRRAAKGEYRLDRADLEHDLDGVLAIWKPEPNPALLKNPFSRGSTRMNTDFSTEERLIRDHPRQSAAKEFKHETARWLMGCFPGRLWLGASRLLQPGETEHFAALEALGRELGIPRVAVGDVRMHRRSRRALMDVLTALRLNRPVAECGLELAANGERHLRPVEALEKLYPKAWLDETLRIAEMCRFDPGRLAYRYPRELVPEPYTPARWLRHLALKGMNRRWPDGTPETVRAQVAKELALIEEMGVEAFFLTVHDVVEFARSRGILCQGRGSAANSAVCYCLGITEVDPSKQQLLFERFISRERNEPPDIDVDFEHERREEVLQYLYEKYGRERAALAATVICYRPKSALKDIGRALGLEPERMRRLTASLAWWDQPDCWHERLGTCGFDPQSPVCRQLLALASQLVGMPRHLSQHVGGMVISDDPLHHLVPVENAAMDGRTVIQWDKDDLETLGLLKVDCLALGMLTALRKSMELVNEWEVSPEEKTGHGSTRMNTDCSSEEKPLIRDHPCKSAAKNNGPLTLASIPREDSATYQMLSRGDAVGVFQVESRAQMAMLPRLRPKCFYDLVIEVAIVRPGPIQGEMVHPYLERRADPDQVRYASPELKEVLQRTLGVPIFQEQVMQIAIVAAGFTPGEADQLRRAMAAWKRRGGLEPFHDKLIDGMLERGYEREFAERIYRQICGFGDYGFPESHAASFALLTYFSAWMKCHHPAAFACGLLNSQPMGFYAPAQIINDARRHGVGVLPVDVRYSGFDCALEPNRSISRGSTRINADYSSRENFSIRGHPRKSAAKEINSQARENQPAIRLGLRMVKGLKREAAEAIGSARAEAGFADVDDLAERAGLDRGQVRALAEAGALKALSGHRHRARWQALAARAQGDLLAGAPIAEDRPRLALPDTREELLADYASLGVSLQHHPLELLRPQLGRRVLTARQLAATPDGRRVEAAGLVTHRQRPGTASGVIFLSLEDETGIVNVIVWPQLAERFRAEVLQGRILKVAGTLQNAGGSQHVVARSLSDRTGLLEGLAAFSRDFQ